MRIKADDFNLEATLESGQVFGFHRTRSEHEKTIATGPGPSYFGRLRGRDVELSMKNGYLVAHGEGLLASELEDYFDLKADLSPVYQILSKDEALRGLPEKLKGLRLIRQDSWEALACFILSSNNNVKRIQHIYKNIHAHFRGFPTASQVAKTHERTLRALGLGYRAPFLQRSAQFISTNPACLDVIREASYEEAKARVLAFPGIGPKVADCVLLYGFHKLEAFPVDVWILRVIRKIYFKNRKVNEARVHAFGQKRWGMDAGYVQQYLFHGARTDVVRLQ